MTVKLAFNGLPRFEDSNGNALSGGFLFTYAAGSSTKQTTYQESTGSTAHANPIVLNSRGEPPAAIWITEGQTYKFVLAPSTDTDPPAAPIWTVDNISGINDGTGLFDEWKASNLTPTYISATQFSVTGDQTTDFHKRRRLKIVDSGGTKYGTVTASSYASITTITVEVDGGGSLASPMTSVSWSLLKATNPSVDADMVHRKSSDSVASAATCDIWSIQGDYVHVTGTTAITSLGTAPYAGAERTVIFDGVLTLTHNATTLQLPSGNNISTAAGDRMTVRADTTANMIVTSYTPANGAPVGGYGANLLVNPNWQIDQINEGALYTVNTTDVRGPDGWSGSAVGAGVFKLRTLADPDNAALKCLEISCTTADAAIAAGDDYFIYTAIEGYDAAALMAGTSSAQPIVVQFKFKTTTTGVYGISIANSALNRRYVGTITVADTSEHEYVVALTMDTTGTWLYTSGVGLYLRICLSAGSTFQATAGAWAAGAEQTTASQCNFMSVNTNIAYLKRIQLVPGTLVQPYRPADLQKELAKAQRYYAKSFVQGTAPAQALGAGTGETVFQAIAAGAAGLKWHAPFPVVMRAAPTITYFNPSAANAQARDISIAADCSSTNAAPFDRGLITTTTGNAGGGVLDQIGFHWTATARLS